MQKIHTLFSFRFSSCFFFFRRFAVYALCAECGTNFILFCVCWLLVINIYILMSTERKKHTLSVERLLLLCCSNFFSASFLLLLFLVDCVAYTSPNKFNVHDNRCEHLNLNFKYLELKKNPY